ncbi:hypothetical protein ABB37_01150 [Leptomonas pyrrhocoris]|uniref:Uncharacterized protein n=1 Tax=Leptomonas pyrrhocoris TaxID=157538 RepID=A0A0M9G8H2_LEPPY|nr:hypothetical protein ABB37_01150 [Leptomonas pyrrhocoris]XP_015663068.1 hypothetical protein ABB37_01150 [Leptomonas pyrrhocoris]KPA84628.1 hypothetical protein ABB37_01150 [Leptomonas pyrrhocoris]KPA84629.1 hypothetical protein ABB37_01150 [Leptomonas pyrrhocoris]|eukprot:XP_015663067.1 hypothetical protein ABB37_01150 [Leptomonas pyrrhocoris]
MNSLFKKFQDVVEMGKEQDTAGILPQEPHGNVTSSSDPAVLRRHIGTLTQQLARQVHSYEELREESAGIEKELMRLRLRFAASRELWDTANEQLEVVIQNLLEHQLFGNTVAASGSAGVAAPSSALDATYVASLHEQIQRLKEMVQRSGEERTQLRCEKQYEQTQLLMKSSGLAGAALDTGVRQALEKLVQHWAEERTQYETTVESLEQHVARHAEREALLSDQIKQEKELRQSTAASVEQSSAAMQELHAVQAELEEWRSGARVVSHRRDVPAAAASPTALLVPLFNASPDVAGPTAEEPQAPLVAEMMTSAAYPNAAAPTVRTDAPVSTPSPPKASSDGTTAHLDVTSPELAAVQELQAELELLHQDYGAREEALDSLYTDNKNLQEALQRAEAQARHSDAELRDCQRRLEEVQKQLAREQHKTQQTEEACLKAVAAEAKLRDQVRELRVALTAAAAAEHDVVVPQVRSATAAGGGLTIPQARGVRVGQPSRYEVAEQSITYEDGGTWREWAVEAGRWWKELKGDAVPLRAPLPTPSGGGAGALHFRSALAPRRGPRVLLLFAGLMGVIMIVFLFLVIVESTYAAFTMPEVQ